MSLKGVIALFCAMSPNSVASGAHCVEVVEDVVVKSSRSHNFVGPGHIFAVKACIDNQKKP